LDNCDCRFGKAQATKIMTIAIAEKEMRHILFIAKPP
jgi:hypothetical protein